jgi:adenine-specific DNA-methyltransferase
VLEGGQTKEDAKRNEVFWNEILAPDEINRLTEPKALTNFKKFNADGEHNVESISKADNLIIKGNNLLALHSLKKTYAGQVKLIYIDPPYNTGSDSFMYNDSFNHSTWLTFMRNRLEIAKQLLRTDGAIFVHIDHHELGYVNILMNDVFGIENKVQVISVKTASPAGFKTVNPGPIDVTEYILFYTKNKPSFNFVKSFVPVPYNSNYNLFLEKTEDTKDWKFIPIKEKVISNAGFKSEKEAKQKYGELWNSISKVMIEDFAYQNADRVVSIRDPHKPTEKVKELMRESRSLDYPIVFERENSSPMYLYKGGSLAFYSNKMQTIDGKQEVTELLTDFWNHISWAGIGNEGGVKLKNGKKPEKLIKQIIELATNENDIILDYHLGSGTTAAVAHKMGRLFIGIEQMDYGDNDSLIRLKNVINGDSTGISKAVNWQGGGSFVYCELAKANQEFADKILTSENKDELSSIWKQMQETGFLSWKVNPKAINENAEDFASLSVEDTQKFLLEALDKNLLYIPYSEIDNQEFGISEEDKQLNAKFYGKA